MKYLIVGAGVAGLYAAYSLNKKLGIKDITIVERLDRIGGRILTKHLKNKNVIIEFGAARIPQDHKNTNTLINELGLRSSVIPGKLAKRYYMELDAQNNIKNNTGEVMSNENFYSLLHPLINKLGDPTFNKFAMNTSLFRLVEHTYSTNTARRMVDMFGYTGDFYKQNAVDGLNMFKGVFREDEVVDSLTGGMSMITEGLQKYLQGNSINIMLKTEFVNFKKKEGVYECKLRRDGQNTIMVTDCIIFAAPKERLLKIPALQNIRPLLLSTINKPLVRIYLFFPLSPNGKVWFDDINNMFTTSGIIRQITPYNKQAGIMQIYCDDGAAESWHYLEKGGLLREEVMYQIRRLFPQKTIPDPTQIKFKFWKNATHMWKPTFDSKKLTEMIIKPVAGENVFIVGESYSLVQQWISGAIETVDKAMKLIGG